MPNFKRIGGGPWKPSVDLTWNDTAMELSDKKADCLEATSPKHRENMKKDIFVTRNNAQTR